MLSALEHVNINFGEKGIGAVKVTTEMSAELFSVLSGIDHTFRNVQRFGSQTLPTKLITVISLVTFPAYIQVHKCIILMHKAFCLQLFLCPSHCCWDEI